jgi:outer membrane lipoprotein-sorting protein
MRNLIVAISLFCLWPVAFAQTAAEKGLAIVKKADSLDVGWKDSEAKMKMVLKDKQGRENIRQTFNRTREIPGDGDKSLTVFESPADIRCTAFLSHTHVKRADDQWLFLRSLRRVKRISSNNKSGPFMGSEFSYEDISSQEVDKYTYKYIKDEKVGNNDTFVIEYYPAYKYSGYTRIIVWMDKKIYMPRKMEFYDRKNSLLKTLYYRKYQQLNNKYWRQREMYMINHQSGKSTTLYWLNRKLNSGLNPSDFDISALRSSCNLL